MRASLLKIGDRFMIETGPVTFKRVETAFEPETVWSEMFPRCEELPVIYAIDDTHFDVKIHRVHPNQEVILC